MLDKNHIFLTSHQDIDTICAPLKENFGITSLVYHKNYNDGSEIKLTNQPAWVEHFCQQQYYKISGFEKHPNTYQSCHVVWSHLSHHQPILQEARKFNIDHGMTFIRKTSDGCEFYFLGTTPDKYYVTNHCLNHIDLIQRFFNYFKEKAAPIILRAEQHKLFIKNKFETVQTEEIGIPNINQNFKENFMQNTKIKKLYLDQNIILSRRELDCIRLLLQGKTASEAAAQFIYLPSDSRNPFKPY
jgi:hypothetical protein